MLRTSRRSLPTIMLVLSLFPLLVPAAALASGFVVIANSNVAESSLSKKELQAIYLGEKVKWESKRYIKISVLEDGTVYKNFLQTVLGKTPSQFDQHWVRMVTTGRASMPQSFGESKQVVDFVAGHPNAIGFVAAGQETAAVKTITLK